MTTYADRTRCPDCHALLPQDPRDCQVCSLPLTGPTVVSLFTSLQEADRLLGVLRSQKQPVPVPPVATSAGSLLAEVGPYPSARRRPASHADGPRLRGESVPKILLSLGALCLLVAAVAFLAVAWQWLGVGGRTVVLVGLTGSALGLAAGLHRRGLRMAAESLSVVGLGLLALDVVGLNGAGWLGSLDDAGIALVTAAAVGAGGLVMLAVTARRPLVAPALVAPVAVLAAGACAQAHHRAPLAMLVTLVLLLGLGRIGTVLPSTPLKVTSMTTVGLAWLSLVADGLDLAGQPITAAHYLGHLACWPLAAATAVAALCGPVIGVRRGVALAGFAIAGLTGTYAVLLPALDNSGTAIVSAALVAAAAWVGVLLVAPTTVRGAALLPLGGTLVVPTVTAVDLLGEAVRALAVGSPFSQPFGVHVAHVATTVSPLLLVPALVTLAAAGCATVTIVQPVHRSVWSLCLGSALAVGTAATLPLYDVPLAVVVAVLVAAAVGGALAAERLAGSTADLTRLGALVLILLAVLIALPSDQMTTAVLAVACALAGWLMVRPSVTGVVASACFPIVFAALVWAGGSVAGIDEQLRAVPVLLALEALALWRPQVVLEATSAAVATIISAASVLAAPDLSAALTGYLTIAGVLVLLSSVTSRSRRLLAWPGGLLLAAATWVRLWDLGVHAPEAYALPSAVVLVVIGAWRLSRDARSATVAYLAPGLTLATVPSLVAMLDDPYSLRALLLGGACLALVVGGAGLRWTAPLVVGAGVGTLLVLRELAPYAADVPTWLTIGASGAVLLVVGITWESRMTDVRRASRYVAALR